MTNVCAFLAMTAISEGTNDIGDQLGYNVLVGSTKESPLLFTGYSDHPRILNRKFNSTAAGRYQIIARTFDMYKKILALSDFSPGSQDAIAVQILKDRGALDDINAGRVASAVAKCSNIWASFTGSPYGQHTQTIEFLIKAFIANGGTILEPSPSEETTDDSSLA